MNQINGFFNSAYVYTKQAVNLGARAVGTSLASFGLARAIRRSGLAAPLTAYTKYWKPACRPFIKINDLVCDILSKVLPALYVTVDNPSAYNLSTCKQIDTSFRCQFPVVSVLQGMTEEILFRGLLLQKILPWVASKAPPWLDSLRDKSTQILITSLIFAAGHNTDDLSQQIAGGLIKGWIAESTGSLAVPVLSHLFSNAVVESLQLYDSSGVLYQITS